MEPSTPPQHAKAHDADNIRKCRFFHAIDHRPENVAMKDVCDQEGIKPDRGKYHMAHQGETQYAGES